MGKLLLSGLRELDLSGNKLSGLDALDWILAEGV